MIGLINYGSGNIMAIANIYSRLNLPFKYVSVKEDLKDITHIVLPGVGDFDETILLLNNTGLLPTIDTLVKEKKMPVLGVCVGMQILGNKSEEGKKPGLGYIQGNVKRLEVSLLERKPHLPHMGWNSLAKAKDSHLLDNVNLEIGFYFLHSYYFQCENDGDILTTTTYGSKFASSISHNNIFGCQFHPEKSHKNGELVFENFAQQS